MFKTQVDLQRHTTSAHPAPVTRPGANGGGIRRAELTQDGISASVSRPKGQLNFRLSDLGTTFEGQKWALKCLHPNSETNSRGFAIPDSSSLPVCVPETRAEITIRAPSALDGTSLPTDQNWDAYVMIPDSMEYSSIVITKPSNVSWAELRANLNSTNTATKPQVNKWKLFSATSVMSDATKWRMTSKGMTIHMDANFIANQGMVYADQWPADFNNLAFGPTDTISTSIRAANMRLPLMDPDSMVQRSPRTYVGNARDGVYIVSYPVRPTVAVDYHDQGTDEPPEGDSDVTAPWMSWCYPDETGVGSHEQAADNAHYKYLSGIGNQCAQSGFTCGVAIFTGLSPTANLQVKLRAGMELVPTSSTIMQAFTGPSPLLDSQALEVVSRVAQQSAGAYPASYNDLSSILGSVWSAVKGIVKPIGEIANFAAGTKIPVISDIGSFVSDISKIFQ